MRNSFITHIFLTLLFLGTRLIAFGQFEEGREVITHSVFQGATFAVNNTASLTYSAGGEAARRIRNIVTLRWDEEQKSLFFQTPFTATVYLKIDRWPTLSASVQTQYQALTINYDTTTGSRYNPMSYVLLDESEKVQVTIDTISINGIPGNGWTPISVLQVDHEMRVLRTYSFSNVGANLNASYNPPQDSTDAVKVSWVWNSAANQNVTQLEWAWVEKEMEDYYKDNGQLNYERMFASNSTRIDLDYGRDSFFIPLLYSDTGKVYYRVRPAYRSNDGTMVSGPWSETSSFSFSGHERKLNWQSTTSYAENGKSKTVIQYFDGSLRPRQTVTKDNEKGNTIVGETIYDLQGRANLQILPAPTLERTIKYFSNLNRFVGQAPNDDPAKYFDLTPAALRCQAPLPLTDSAGTGMYYSARNPWLGVDSSARYIPDAGGYAYSETRYTDDATQRVKAQGGVGPYHQIGSGHETKYFYGKPGQQELDALFGTEVGDASHYFKNMVQDANGQMSISYVDMHGRTIATALAGDSTYNLNAIYTNNSFYPLTSRFLTNQLVTPATNIVRNNAIESVNTLLAPATTLYKFTYQLDPAVLSMMDCFGGTVCFDCKYDLEFSIRSEDCSDTNIITRTYRNLQIVPANQACGTSMGFVGPGVNVATKQITFDTTLSSGAWVVRKTLKLNDSMYALRRDSAVSALLCRSRQQIYDSIYAALVQQTGCGAPNSGQVACDSCNSQLGTFVRYKAKYLRSIGVDTTSSLYDAEIHIQYSQDSLNCATLCGGLNSEFSTLKTLRRQLLTDMTPFTGQYALEAITDDQGNPAPDRLEGRYNIFTTYPARADTPYYRHPKPETGGLFYYLENGQVDSAIHFVDTTGHPYLQSASNSSFASLFQPSWAASLIKYHPEYSKLHFAETTLKSSYDWLDSVLNCNTYAKAAQKGYLTPLTSDPYMVNHYVQDHVDTMQKYLYIRMGRVGNPSMWRLANGNALCGGADGDLLRQCMASKDSLAPQSGTSTQEKDEIWDQFRSIYLSYRNEMVLDYINSQNGVLSAADMSTLISEGKTLAFAKAQQIADQNGWDFWETAAGGGQPNSSSWGNYGGSNMPPTDKCLAQKPFWRARLLQCAALANLKESDSTTFENVVSQILDSFVNVCHATISATQPYGATTTQPGYIGVPKTFEEVVNHVFHAYGLDNSPSLYCNPFSVDFPKPFGLNPAVTTNISNTVDSCGCGRFKELKLEAAALYDTNSQHYDTTSFVSMNRFFKAIYNDSLTQVLWNGLLKCDSSRQVLCTYDLRPVPHYWEGETGRTSSNGCSSNLQITIANAAILQNFSGKNLQVSYNVSGSYDTCLIDITDLNGNIYLHQQIFPTQGVNVDSFTVPTCQEYYVWIRGLVNTCPGYAFGASTMVVPSICTSCPRPYVKSVTVGVPDSLAGTEPVTVTYSVPAGQTGYVVATIFADGHQYIAPVSHFDSSVTYNLFRCLKYTIEIHTFVTAGNSCQIVYSSDSLILDSCYRTTCRSAFKPVQLQDFTVIPTFLNCGYQKPCITCGKLDSLVTEFHQIFPAYAATPYLDSTATDAELDQNALLARFLNYRTGFSKNALNYLAAYRNCHLPNTPPTTNALCAFDRPLNDPSDYFEPDTVKCKAAQIQAEYLSIYYYQLQKDSLLARFDSLYKAKCLTAQASERFWVQYQPKEYHYTLYYYDQAGNLVKTLPPAAVKPQFDSIYLVRVDSLRNLGQALVNRNNWDSSATEYRYNGLNQPVAQTSPDGGGSRFWYDRLGRLVVSQNAKQKAAGAYSYTLYDVLGRISEVGEKLQSADPISRDTAQLTAWIVGGGIRRQITHTQYDIADSLLMVNAGNVRGFFPKNLRNRVAFTYVQSLESLVPWDAATFYSYDIHGSVDTLLQDYRTTMGALTCTGNTDPSDNRFKRIVYNYDLVSGKVNSVAYQPGQRDQFYHRYAYDAENKITLVETSRDSLVWERDAAYEYYRHGPLSRTVLGPGQGVQGLDYAYAIQGWLKGVNSSSVGSALYDMGRDGLSNALHSGVGRDAFGFVLNYFDTAGTIDYKPIDVTARPFASTQGAGLRPLFNGNIAAQQVNLPKVGAPQLYRYAYDQLNRLVGMNTITGLNGTTNAWSPLLVPDYGEKVSYDPNGNILTYARNGTTAGGSALQMDSLRYQYYYMDSASGLPKQYNPLATLPSGVKRYTNRLASVKDTVNAANYSDDIDQQADNNYSYDAIGNLTADQKEGISKITWNVYGKIDTVVKNGNQVVYTYDAQGNRISKATPTKTTYYVRDASGNVISIYERKDTLKQTEINLYGSTRLGMYSTAMDMQNCAYVVPTVTQYQRGAKQYELANHLGNVLATVSDKKIGVASGNAIGYFIADVVTEQDYYPFGMVMPGRRYPVPVTGPTPAPGGGTSSSPVEVYRHGFGTTALGTTYTVAPDAISSYLTSSQWALSSGSFTSYVSNSGFGQAIGISAATPTSTNLTLSFNVQSGYSLSVTSFSFYARSSATGYTHWTLTIGGVQVGTDSIFTSSTSSTLKYTGLLNVALPVNGLTGSVNAVLTLWGGSHGYNGTTRIDNFVLNGYVQQSYLYDQSGSIKYRYAFNGKESDGDIGIGIEDYGMRISDSRLGRFLTSDPITHKYPMLTPYQFASNCPISGIDLDGLEYYYAPDGTFVGRTRDGNKQVRVINAEQVASAWAMLRRKEGATKGDFDKISTDVGINNSELNLRAFLTLIRHAERHSVEYPEEYTRRNEPDKKTGQYPTSKGKTKPFGGYQLYGSTFRSNLNDKNARTTPENQDKAAVNDLKTFKKGSGYELIIGDGLTDRSLQKETLQKISDIVGSPASTVHDDSQWPSLPGQSQEGLNIDQAIQVFKKAVADELAHRSVIQTPQGELTKETPKK